MSKSLRIVLEELSCSKTTEMGEDEVFVLVAGANSAKGAISSVAPSASGHWDMNDHGDKSLRTLNHNFYIGEIPDNSLTFLSFQFMEQDGGNAGTYIKVVNEVGGNVAQQVFGKTYPIAGTVISAVQSAIDKVAGWLPIDTDDFLGSFNLIVNNKGGTVTIDWEMCERTHLVTRSQVEQSIQSLEKLSKTQPFMAGMVTVLKLNLFRYGATAQDLHQVITFDGDGSNYRAYLRIDVW